ncbi:MAG: HD domain-containing protein [Deferribacteraceae bacterium]|jgi:HD-GYP domain-containing protein (c-di-GMP phosphodiesterase class II)|nr:HD domain-containing protein [Deferribacteraceae bacterium]
MMDELEKNSGAENFEDIDDEYINNYLNTARPSSNNNTADENIASYVIPPPAPAAEKPAPHRPPIGAPPKPSPPKAPAQPSSLFPKPIINEPKDEFSGSDWRTWLGASYVQKRGIEIMKTVITDLKSGKKINIQLVLQLIEDLLTSCRQNEEHFINLTRVKDTGNYSFSHPVNVAICSIAVGATLQFNSKQLVRLGLAALFHDIGEIKLPDRMLNKYAKYTGAELAAMQKHPALGVEVLKKDGQVPEDVMFGVFHHHERLDGSGYPSGHLGRFIHPLGKIIALAETFDAMTSIRHNVSSNPPVDVLKTIYSLSGKHYDPNAVKALIMLLGIYPMGSLVRLSGGQLAVAFTKNKKDLSKPSVIVITDNNGQPIEPFLVNLCNDPSARWIAYAEDANIMQVDTNKYIQDYLLRHKTPENIAYN